MKNLHLFFYFEFENKERKAFILFLYYYVESDRISLLKKKIASSKKMRLLYDFMN